MIHRAHLAVGQPEHADAVSIVTLDHGPQITATDYSAQIDTDYADTDHPMNKQPDIPAPRPAATVIVVREGNPFEILMVKRNDKWRSWRGRTSFQVAASMPKIVREVASGSLRRGFPI